MTDKSNNAQDSLDQQPYYWHRFKKWIGSANISILFVVPFLLGLAFGLSWNWVLRQIIHRDLPISLTLIGGVISCFLMGLSGLPVILREEFPPMTFVSIKGAPAVLFGWLYTLFWWGLACEGIWVIAMKLTKP